LLKAIGLTKRYGDHLALDELNLEIGPGQIFCMLGANGAGKTTTINLFLNFISPTKGQALIDGMDVQEHPMATRRRLSFIPENVAFYPSLTGLENLAYFCELSGKKLPSKMHLSLLEQVGLPKQAAEKRMQTYSKGMRQKVAIAVALAKEAKVMLLDEPTSGLDPKASNELSETLNWVKGRGTSVLMTSHDLFRARETGDWVGIMDKGRLQTVLETREIDARTLEAIYLNRDFSKTGRVESC